MAVSVEPVKTTPSTRGSRDQRRADRGAIARQQMQHLGGMPASCSSRTAAAAISGVCSAGLASTALPAASAAAIWPVKMASGKFHGLMQAKTPRPPSDQRVASPVGPGSCSRPKSAWRAARSSAEVDGLAHFGERVGQGLAGFAHASAISSGHARFQQVGGAIQARRARARPAARPTAGAAAARVASACSMSLGVGLGDLADDAAAIGGSRRSAAPPRQPRRRRSARRPSQRGRLGHGGCERGERRLVEQIEPLAFCRAGP